MSVHSTQQQSPCTRVHKGSFVLGADPGQKLVSMQSSILSPLPRAARALPPQSPALFTPATVAESQRSAGGGWRVLGAGARGNATLLLNLDTGAALSPAAVLGLDNRVPSNRKQLHYFFFLSSIAVNWLLLVLSVQNFEPRADCNQAYKGPFTYYVSSYNKAA